MPQAFRRILLFLSFSALCVFASDSHVRVVRLSYVNGSVEMDRGTGNGYEKALLNMPVIYQSHLRTGSDGEAELEFENGSTFRLTPDTEITVSDLSLTDTGAHVTHIRLDHGLAYVEWKRSDGADFQVDSNGHIVELKKSSHLRISADDQQTVVSVFNGEANVSGATNVDVKRGETLTLDNAEGDRYFLARNVESGAYDAWDKDRDDARSAVAARQANAYVSDAAYYGPDLGYYGNWISGGQYWQPYGVAAGWNPYADGSWAWYPGWGWQWVSAYPWGFVPYHYGSWVYVPGYGYCWHRPSHWRGWNNITLVVNNFNNTNIYRNGHGTGIVPPNGTHDTGTLPPTNIVPRPPREPQHGETIVAVGRGPNVEWRDPVVRTGHDGQERTIPAQSFRGGTGANGAVASNPLLPTRPVTPSGNVEVHMARPDRTVAPRPGTIATQDVNPKQRPYEAPDRMDTPRTTHTPAHPVEPPATDAPAQTVVQPARQARPEPNPVRTPPPAAAATVHPAPTPAPVRVSPPPPAPVRTAPMPSPAMRGGGDFHPAPAMGGTASHAAPAPTGTPRNPK